MKFDKYDIFESDDLQFFPYSGKYNGLLALLDPYSTISNKELISPRELISSQLSFPNQDDLKLLREDSYRTRAMLIDKRMYDRKTTPMDAGYYSQQPPELMIVSPGQFDTRDIVSLGGHGLIDSAGAPLRATARISQDHYTRWAKDALHIPSDLIEDFFKNLKHDRAPERGIQDIKWKQEFMEFIMEGDQKLLQDYIKYSEEITNKPFYKSLVVAGYEPGYVYLDNHLLHIWSPNIFEGTINPDGSHSIIPPTFTFNDNSNGVWFGGTNFIGVTKEFSEERKQI